MFGNKEFWKEYEFSNSLAWLANKKKRRSVISFPLICGKYYIAREQTTDTLLLDLRYSVLYRYLFKAWDALNVSLTQLKCVILNNERQKSIT